MSQIDMSRGIELANELVDRLYEESDNAAELLSNIAVAIRILQSYNDCFLLSTNMTLRGMPVRREGE